ncbi:hypothetical protein [Aminobacter aminovorans]|uniref:hypothetical protein n=1 Tax=Aminobacter aminovorans TaxID=83263 RepID=UPI0028628EBF|nr:hypothetical protein [Aminobacter aminovorans]MDR7219853.1 hypothetical protein [Aminobacter aminovorans]
MSIAQTLTMRTAFASICVAGLAATVSAFTPTPAEAQRLIRCASEGGTCRLPYPAEVVYGAQGRTTSRFIDAPAVRCSNRSFGDPAPGLRKECYIVERGRRGRDYGDDGGYGEPRRKRWAACANENEYCDFYGRKRVRYGTMNQFEEGVFRDGVDCDNETFGDPAPGVRKRCYIQD